MKWEKYAARDIIPLNFGCPRVILEKALDRMASALEKNLQNK
jgi:bifunctional pyridoxal-dependent enzyme with beta-cystathionase and maltose regulon repressor activities